MPISSSRRGLVPSLFLFAITGVSNGQVFAQEAWKESPAPPPPAYGKTKLIPLDMPGSTLQFGIDPATLSIGDDGVLRYVVVAESSSGSINALYEGLRCKNWQVKTYARSTSPGHWTMASHPQWQPLGSGRGTLHALALARQGACKVAQLSAPTVPELIPLLRKPRQQDPN